MLDEGFDWLRRIKLGMPWAATPRQGYGLAASSMALIGDSLAVPYGSIASGLVRLLSRLLESFGVQIMSDLRLTCIRIASGLKERDEASVAVPDGLCNVIAS